MKTQLFRTIEVYVHCNCNTTMLLTIELWSPFLVMLQTFLLKKHSKGTWAPKSHSRGTKKALEHLGTWARKAFGHGHLGTQVLRYFGTRSTRATLYSRLDPNCQRENIGHLSAPILFKYFRFLPLIRFFSFIN